MHESSYLNMLRFVEKYIAQLDNQKLCILEVGSCNEGQMQYRDFFDNSNWTYLGADIVSGIGVDVVFDDPYTWKFEDNTFDFIISGQAFEHIEFPWLTIGEVSRVLKPGGMTCIIAPGECGIHKHPLDCWRFNPDGFTALAKWGNLKVIECYRDENSPFKDCVLIGKKEL